jgi:hypothetical protein
VNPFLDLYAVRVQPAPVVQVEVGVNGLAVPAGAGDVGLLKLVAAVASVAKICNQLPFSINNFEFLKLIMRCLCCQTTLDATLRLGA